MCLLAVNFLEFMRIVHAYLVHMNNLKNKIVILFRAGYQSYRSD
jgi:hypothetical protein